MIWSSQTWTRMPEVPLHEALFFGIRSHHDKIALVDAEDTRKTYTYNQYYKAVTSVASALTKQGFGKGDILAFFAPNSTEYVIGATACFSIGATFTGVNFNYKKFELLHQMSDSGADAIFTTSQFLPIVKETLADKSHRLKCRKVITIDKPAAGCLYFGDLLQDNGSAYPQGLAFNVREDVAAIMYSSGTTGLPKGVMLTHYNLVANICQITAPGLQPERALGEQLVALGFLPMFHMYGILILISMIAIGSKVVTISGFVPETFLKTIEEQKVTQLYLVPPVVVFLAKSPLVSKYDVRSVKFVLSGAAPLSEDVEREFLRKFHLNTIHQGYGMTETTAAVTVVPFGKHKAGSSGPLTLNSQIKIEDVVTRRLLSTGQEGEICIKGPQVMKGYLNNIEATRNTIDQEGWLHSGDVGYFDEDNYLYITGRIKELIKHKGFQVAPAELEGVLMTHPDIVDAAVIGIPDTSAGELPRAFVVKRPNARIKEKDVSDFIQERLTRHKWLTGGVQFVSAIPKTASGKIIRRDVKKLMTSSKL